MMMSALTATAAAPAAALSAAPSSSSLHSTALSTSGNESFSYWMGLARHIESVAVISAAATNSHAAFSPEPPYTRYTLQGILLFCGIKQHYAVRTTDYIIAQVLSAAYASSATVSASPATVLVEADDTTSIPHTLAVKDWTALYDTSSAAAAAPSSIAACHCQLQAPLSLWERAIVKALGNTLRGQMICLRPLLRWNMACAQQRGNSPTVVFIGGTSGSGKSTLARLVASQLRIPNVLSTDTVRQALRARLADRRDEFPTLFVSTYQAHKVASEGATTATDGSTKGVLDGYKSQCTLVLQVLDGMLSRLLSRGESVVIEGVHLLPKYLARKRAELLVQHVVCVPVLVQIPKADNHLERFCIRSRGMSLKSNSKYIASFPAIRAIQDYLVTTTERAALPVLVLANTNVDKSFLVIHHALLEAMECAALHGWPATAAATAQVPLTPLAFAATKERLVAVVRQRRQRHGTGEPFREHHHTRDHHDHQRQHQPTRPSSNGDFLCVREEHSGHSLVTTPTVNTRTVRPSPRRRSPLDFPCCSAGASSTGLTSTVPSRARSAEMFAMAHRRLHGHEALSHSRQGSFKNVDLCAASTTAEHHVDARPIPLTLPPVPMLSPAYTTSTASDAQPMYVSKHDGALSDGEHSPFLKAAPRRCTTIDALHPCPYATHSFSRENEEAFEEDEVPSLIGSCTEIPIE